MFWNTTLFAAVWYPLCKNIFSEKKKQKDKTSEPKFQSLFVCLFIDMFYKDCQVVHYED